jgi:uncharacterized peroxidase-related enzyme
MHHHGAGLRRLLTAKQVQKEIQNLLLRSLELDYTEADITPADQVMLDYAVKLTRTPSDISAQDITTLKEHGLNNRAIHDLCSVTAYFAFVNRIADGLGVELED